MTEHEVQGRLAWASLAVKWGDYPMLDSLVSPLIGERKCSYIKWLREHREQVLDLATDYHWRKNHE